MQIASVPWSEVHERFTSYAQEAERFAVGLNRPARILDVACGTGQHLIELAGFGHVCVGADRAFGKVRAARVAAAAAGLNVTALCADARSLPFRRSFDMVLFLYALSILKSDEDVIAALSNAARLLDNGGRLVCNVINAAANRDPRSPTYAAVHQRRYLRDYTAKEIAALVGAAGLVVDAVEPHSVGEIEGLDLHVWTHPRSEQ